MNNNCFRFLSGSLPILQTRALMATALMILIVGVLPSAEGATLCVNPRDGNRRFASIQVAIAAAAPNDTITVAPGVYREDVTIDKALSLVGANPINTTIDATGNANGIDVDGIDNPGLANVVISGFTIKNANFEGIVVTNASDVTVWNNVVLNNNLSLAMGSSGPICPGIPSWETMEGFDCGEGIHLSGVDHSTVANNEVGSNAGGILLSDDTGATHDNLVKGNNVHDNPFDCGITLPSHPPAALTGTTSPFGVYHNMVSDNISTRNGLANQEGAGVGIFASVPGAAAYGNVVIHNTLTNNGMPGVALHSHTPNQNLSDNVIADNYIAGNHADSGDAATPGPTGINVFGVSAADGTVISQNRIENEDIGIAVKSPTQVQVHLNDFLVATYGVDNLGVDGSVNATQNWWDVPLAPVGRIVLDANGVSVAVVPILSGAIR